MEDILTQRFNYAIITNYKNYSLLTDKKNYVDRVPKNMEEYNPDVDGIFSFDDILNVRSRRGNLFSFPPKRGKRRTHYFHGPSDIEERYPFNYSIVDFHTRKDKHIKNHYGNPFSDIRIDLIERSVRRRGDKITIRLYRKIKHRYFNAIYFKSTTQVTSITINMVTGNFTILNYSKSGKAVSTRFRTNCFISLNEICRQGSIFEYKTVMKKTTPAYSEYKESINDDEFSERVNNLLGFDSTIKYKGENFKSNFINLFVTLKKIKVSNNFFTFLTCLYPTEKFLKKNDRKLIASVLDSIKIKSKITNKLVHEYPELDIVSLSRLCYFFGDNYTKYIGSIDPDVFKHSKNSRDQLQLQALKNRFLVDFKDHKFFIKDVEKENIVKILNSEGLGRNDNTLNRIVDEFHDHFNMIKKLRDYQPDLQLRGKNYREFHDEHLELSKMITFIKKGWVIEYQFAENMVTAIQQPIKSLNDNDVNDYVMIYPHILKREEEYDEEGRFMHHCVASYSNKDRSIIISLRTEDLSDRVTCEFDCDSGELIQARHFCNGTPPDYIAKVLEILKGKVVKFARMGLVKSIEKKKVPVKINGIEIEPKLETYDILTRMIEGF